MDFISQPWFIADLVLVLVLIAGICLVFYHLRKLNRAQKAMELIVKELAKAKESQKKKFGELQTLSVSAGQKILDLDKRLQDMDERQQEFQQEISVHTPENRLYSRAARMVELGAGLEEIMRECELPKAEAELLMTLHRSQN